MLNTHTRTCVRVSVSQSRLLSLSSLVCSDSILWNSLLILPASSEMFTIKVHDICADWLCLHGKLGGCNWSASAMLYLIVLPILHEFTHQLLLMI